MSTFTRLHSAEHILHSFADFLAQRRKVSIASCTAAAGEVRVCRLFQEAGVGTGLVYVEDRFHMP